MLNNVYFRVFVSLISIGLLVSSVYWGLYKHDYAQACYDILLVMLMDKGD